jgi:hypothetical protein
VNIKDVMKIQLRKILYVSEQTICFLQCLYLRRGGTKVTSPKIVALTEAGELLLHHVEAGVEAVVEGQLLYLTYIITISQPLKTFSEALKAISRPLKARS